MTTRRELLVGGALAAAFPFLRVRPATAQVHPRRLLVVCTPLGTIMRHYWPADGKTFGRILEPLQPFAPRLNVLRGVDMKTADVKPGLPDHGPDFINLLIARQGHGPKGAWLPSGISIDQHIAAVVGRESRFASLQLGANVAAYAGIVSARGYDLPNLPENSAAAAFRRLFGGATGGAVDPSGADRYRRRKSVIDRVAKDVAALRCRLTSDDRAKLDGHLAAVREMEVSLDRQQATPVPATCKSPPAPMEVDFPTRVRAQMDNAVAALSCNLTRVITLQCSFGGSGVVHKWADPTITGKHHGIAHNSDGVNSPLAQREEWLTNIETWYAKQFAYLLERMDAVKEGTGSLLDNSLVVWAHEQQDGYSHSRKNMPWVLAGGCGGAVKTGQVLDFAGRAHNDLLATFATVMGVPTKEFGDPQFATGPMMQLMTGV